MSVRIEALKQMNLVDFLTGHYGLTFSRNGSSYVASSPFGADRGLVFLYASLMAGGCSRISPAVSVGV